MVSFKAACFRLGIDRATLYRLIREGKLECRKSGLRGRNYVTLGSVEEMEQAITLPLHHALSENALATGNTCS